MQTEDKRWVIYYKASNPHSVGTNWKLLTLERHSSRKRIREGRRGKITHVFSYPSRKAAESAASLLYGTENCRITPLPENCGFPEYRVKSKVI